MRLRVATGTRRRPTVSKPTDEQKLASESAWLVERPGPFYMRGTQSGSGWKEATLWTSDPWEATKFERRCDVETEIEFYHIPDAKAVEHLFFFED
jgi:hypothetical protein